MTPIAVDTNPYKNYAWGIDVSQYVASDPKALQKWVDAGCSFLVAKCGDGHQITGGDAYDPTNYIDPQFAGWCQAAYDVDFMGRKGIPFMAYYYMRVDVPQEPNPALRDKDFQFRVIKEALNNKACCAIFIDIEEKNNTNSNINKLLRQLYSWINQEPIFNPMYRGIYTRTSYLVEYCPDAIDWIGANDYVDPLWLARWIYNPGIKIPLAKLKDYWPAASTKLITPGFSNWRFWQILGDAVVDGYPHALDINIYNGSLEKLLTWATAGGYKQHGGYTPPQPSTDTPPQPSTDTSPSTDELQDIKLRLDKIESRLDNFKINWSL